MFVRLLFVVAALVVALSAAVRPSGGAGGERTYVVRPGDTLWSLAVRTYSGDPREGVWRLQRRNGLRSPDLEPGQELMVP